MKVKDAMKRGVVGRRQVDLLKPSGASPPSTPAGRARDVLHTRSHEAVTLEDLVLAGEFTTKQQLIRSFRVTFGVTPHQYLTQLRLQQARDLLRRGRKCGETAHMVGFYDQSQMNRHFAKYCGVTPGAYATKTHGTSRPLRPLLGLKRLG